MPVIFECPAGEAPGDFLDIPLRVAAMDAERVQLHQLPGIIFVGNTFPVRGVVQIAQHRRRPCRGSQQIAKFPEGVAADRRVVIYHFKLRAQPFERIDIEMIRPELDHALRQLLPTVDRPQQGHLSQCLDDPMIVFIEKRAGIGVQRVGQASNSKGENWLLRERLRCQLLGDIGRDADTYHMRKIPGTRPVSSPVQHTNCGRMERQIRGWQRISGKPGLCQALFESFAAGEQGCGQPRRTESQQLTTRGYHDTPSST